MDVFSDSRDRASSASCSEKRNGSPKVTLTRFNRGSSAVTAMRRTFHKCNRHGSGVTLENDSAYAALEQPSSPVGERRPSGNQTME